MTSGEICLVGSPYMILRYQPDPSNEAIDYQHLLKKKKKKRPQMESRVLKPILTT